MHYYLSKADILGSDCLLAGSSTAPAAWLTSNYKWLQIEELDRRIKHRPVMQ